MAGIKRILFTTDFSEFANHALKYAIGMAKVFDAELTMLHAVTVYRGEEGTEEKDKFPSLDRYCEEVESDANGRFEICIADMGDAGIKVAKEVVRGKSPHAAILDYLRKNNDIGMVVMSTHGRGGLSHVLVGSVTENVIRYAGIPVLAVKKTEHETTDPETGEVIIKKILFPLDFSRESLRPLELVKSVAGKYGAEVIVFHSIDVEVPPIYYTSGIDSILQLDPDIKVRVEKRMKEMIGDTLSAIPVRFLVSDGRAVEQIREQVMKERVDLVAMSSSGSHGIGEFFFGSTATRVIQKAICPVLVV